MEEVMQPLPGAELDFLTHFYTKQEISRVLDKLKEEYEATRKIFSILLLDVDHFKSFNDRYGHLHGDKVLEYFASSARLNLESVDYAGFRFGGDEFLIVLPGRADDATQFLADRLQKNIRHRSFLLKGSRFRMSFSAGIASFPRDGKSTDELLANADKALYFAKRSGRRRSKQFRRIGFED